MAELIFTIIGAVAVILGLAGISLFAVWIQGRLDRRERPSGCSGVPSLERCRTCRYMQNLGDDSYCSLLAKEVLREDGESESV